MEVKDNIQVHLIQKEFNVTPEIRRFINLYLLVGKYCYLIDSGVDGSEKEIEAYLKTIQRTMSDIKGIFLTHSHPDHAGAAAVLKKQTQAKIYAPFCEVPWLESVEQQFKERPIPNFYTLFSKAIKVDQPLYDGDIIELEEGMSIKAISTPGHSHGSMSYLFNEKYLFCGDAIPLSNDVPIFVNWKASIQSLDKIQNLDFISYCCPAWDHIYQKEEFKEVVKQAKTLLNQWKETVEQVEQRTFSSEQEKVKAILYEIGLEKQVANPLVVKSIRACIDAKK